MSEFMAKVAWFKQKQQEDIGDTKHQIKVTERHLKELYHAYMQNMLNEMIERQAAFDEQGHVLNYRFLYRFNQDVLDPKIKELEALRERLVAKLIDITPPESLLLHYINSGWALYMLVKEKYPAVNAHTRLDRANWAYGPEIKYSILQEPQALAIKPDEEMSPIMAHSPMKYGTAYFNNWMVDGERGAFAFAPEINTIFYK